MRKYKRKSKSYMNSERKKEEGNAYSKGEEESIDEDLTSIVDKVPFFIPLHVSTGEIG